MREPGWLQLWELQAEHKEIKMILSWNFKISKSGFRCVFKISSPRKGLSHSPEGEILCSPLPSGHLPFMVQEF